MTAAQIKRTGTNRLVDTVEEAEHTSLEAVRKFVDTVDSVFPHLGGDDGPRRKIIDSAFKMTEQLVQIFLDVTRKTLTESGRKSASKALAKKAPAKKAGATKKAVAKKAAPAKKAGAAKK
jgi:hypothetical protein